MHMPTQIENNDNGKNHWFPGGFTEIAIRRGKEL